MVKESIVEAQVETHTSDYHLHAEKWTTMDTSATPEYKFLPLRMFHNFRTVPLSFHNIKNP